MVNLSVKCTSLFLDEQHRFVRMLFLAAILHLLLFLTLDVRFNTMKPLKNMMAQIIDVRLNPEQPEIEYTAKNQSSNALPELEGITFGVKPQEQKRRRTVSAAAHESRDASYLTRWQSYVEQYGNNHYPEVALKNNLRGNLRLLVAVNKDGTIHEVSIRQSSGSAVLDQAAINLVYQAAPFEPLPPEVANDIEILEIIRTWQFRGKFSTS